jgi:hypothetical protein
LTAKEQTGRRNSSRTYGRQLEIFGVLAGYVDGGAAVEFGERKSDAQTGSQIQLVEVLPREIDVFAADAIQFLAARGLIPASVPSNECDPEIR